MTRGFATVMALGAIVLLAAGCGQASKAPAATGQAVRADCKQLFRSMSAEVMDFLIKANWYEADAARLGIDPSSAEVDNAFNTEKDKTFPTAAGFRAFLAKTGQTVADVHFRVRVNEVVKRLVAREKGSQTARQNVVASEVKKLYQPTTTCTPSVAIADCGS